MRFLDLILAMYCVGFCAITFLSVCIAERAQKRERQACFREGMALAKIDMLERLLARRRRRESGAPQDRNARGQFQ